MLCQHRLIDQRLNLTLTIVERGDELLRRARGCGVCMRCRAAGHRLARQEIGQRRSPGVWHAQNLVASDLMDREDLHDVGVLQQCNLLRFQSGLGADFQNDCSFGQVELLGQIDLGQGATTQ